jgi:hypothetical protein
VWAALDGREFVIPDDVASLVEPVFAHRLIAVRGSATARGRSGADTSRRRCAASSVRCACRSRPAEARGCHAGRSPPGEPARPCWRSPRSSVRTRSGDRAALRERPPRGRPRGASRRSTSSVAPNAWSGSSSPMSVRSAATSTSISGSRSVPLSRRRRGAGTTGSPTASRETPTVSSRRPGRACERARARSTCSTR